MEEPPQLLQDPDIFVLRKNRAPSHDLLELSLMALGVRNITFEGFRLAFEDFVGIFHQPLTPHLK